MTLTDAEAAAIFVLATTAAAPAYSILDALLAKGAIRLRIDAGDFCYLIAEWAMHQAGTRKPEPPERNAGPFWSTDSNWANTSTASGGPTMEDLFRMMRQWR